MNKKHYEILKAIIQGWDKGGLNRKTIQDLFPDLHIHHYVRLLNKRGFIEENTKVAEGKKRNYLVPTEAGREILKEYESSCLQSEDMDTNLKAIGKKLKSFTSSTASKELMLSYEKTAVILKQAFDMGILNREKEGREWIYSLTESA